MVVGFGPVAWNYLTDRYSDFGIPENSWMELNSPADVHRRLQHFCYFLKHLQAGVYFVDRPVPAEVDNDDGDDAKNKLIE